MSPSRLGMLMRGWANYFRHAVAKWTFSKLDAFTWWRLIRMLKARHRWSWRQLRRHLITPDGKWRIAADGIGYFRLESVTVARYTYRGNKIPSPWPTRTTA
jgi:RNA-directed DNA polymerase